MPRSRESNERYQALRDSYLEKLPKQLDLIDTGWSKLNNINWNAQQLDRLQRAVHSIAGTADSFGLTRLCAEAQQLDAILRGFIEFNHIPDTAAKIKAYTHIQSMIESSRVFQDLPVVEYKLPKHYKKVLIVDDDEEQATYLELLCYELGCTTQILKSPKQVAGYIKTEVPDIILMDIVFPEGQLIGIDSIENIYQDIGFKIPIVFVSSRNDLSSRVKAFRAGGLGYLHKPVNFSELKIQFELLDNHQTYHAKILIVDDDPNFTDLVSTMLESQGFYCIASHQPAEIIYLLERHRPDILLLDINMPKLQGDEIWCALRQEIKYAKLPILMISADTSAKTIGFATANGANGLIPKPLEFNVLLDSIHSALKSTKSMDAVIERVTKQETQQSVQRHYFFSKIEQAIRLSAQTKRQMLASISFKNHENIRRQIGFTHIDDLTEHLLNIIQQDLQNNEYVTRISELHFALILSNTSQASLDRRLEKLLDRINALEYKHNGYAIPLQGCLSAIHLSSKIPSVDEALQIVESQILELIKSKSDYIAIQKCDSTRTLSDDELKQTVVHALQQRAVYLNYQPIIDVAGNQHIFEGLARMRDQNGAIILPDDFIEKIKIAGKQQEFNKLLVSQCIQDIKKLYGQEAQEIEIVVKLLLATSSILPFLDWVSNNLRTSNLLGSNRLIFSVSMNDLVKHEAQILELHTGLKELNCGLMLEQVSAQAIANINFSGLIDKIDISFFKLHSSMTRSLIRQDEDAMNLLAILKKQQIPIIATHVEDNSMFSKLWETGIRHFQGYFVRRPEESLSFDFNIESTEL